MDTYICIECNLEKSIKDFSPTPTKLGHKRKCKSCVNSYMRQYYKNKPEQYSKHIGYVKNNDQEYKRKSYFRHGLTEIEFQEMLSKFGGRCWACQEDYASVVDHDHLCCAHTFSCGDCIRGLLCNGCNSALGHAKDSVDRLEKLIKYLHP